MKTNKEVKTQIKKGSNTQLNLNIGAETIYREMNEELEALAPANKLQKAQLSFQTTVKAAANLKQLADCYDFESEAEEIHFYKTTYVEILEEVYYFILKYEFEAHSPYKDLNQKANYLQHTLIRHKSDLEKEHSFFNYIHLDQTHLDAKYFCRDSDMPTPPDIAIGLLNYASPCDYYAHKFARIQALIRHISELQQELTELNDDGVTASEKNDNGLVWTDSKVALIELVYALYAQGSVNNENVTLKRLISAFEELFNTNLDNYLTLFKQSIRMRKGTRTQFLEALISSLTERMDKYDEMKVRN